MRVFRRLTCLALLVLVPPLLQGCAASPRRTPGDPLEPVNRTIHRFNDVADRYVTRPVARAYEAVLPQFVRTGVRNFFNNLDDVFVVGNDLLQGKLTQASQDGVRLVSNTVFGGFGLVDVASMRGLRKNNEDFGQTLGRWGLGSGPYLVLPLLGPSSVRDLGGFAVHSQLDPIWRLDDVSLRNSALGLNLVNNRAALLPAERLLDQAMDRYAFIRDAYLQRRLNLVHDGNPPKPPQGDEDFEDPGEGSADQP